MTNRRNNAFTKLIKQTDEPMREIRNSSHANRGLNFEHEIELSNNWYNEEGVCMVLKRPTPIKVIGVDHKRMRITDAVYLKQSTLDYSGVYRGRYIDFEAKSTQLSSFPISNVLGHQIKHIEKVLKHEGISFLLISFEKHQEVFFVHGRQLISLIENGVKSIKYDWIKENCHSVPLKFNPRIDYISVLKNYVSSDVLK